MDGWWSLGAEDCVSRVVGVCVGWFVCGNSRLGTDTVFLRAEKGCKNASIMF